MGLRKVLGIASVVIGVVISVMDMAKALKLGEDAEPVELEK